MVHLLAALRDALRGVSDADGRGGEQLAAAFWLQVAGDGHFVLLSGSPSCLRIDVYFFKSLQS